MKILPLSIEGVVLCEHPVHDDRRGFFEEVFRLDAYAAAGIGPFVQDNRSRSVKGTVRGLHYQLRNPQAKLVTVIRGSIFDAVVDVRAGSPTFGRSLGMTLSEHDGRQLYVPPGFAHGFCVLGDVADVHYKCSAYFAPGDDRGIQWSDPALGIAWPIADPIVSERDAGLPRLSELGPEALPAYEGSPGNRAPSLCRGLCSGGL